MRSERKIAIILIVPALLILISIVIFPLLFSINVSLRNYDIRRPKEEYPFVGIANYIRAFTDSRFYSSLFIMAQFICLGITLQLLIGLGLAVLLSSITWRKYVLPIIVIPTLIPPIVAGYMGIIIFHPEGPINYMLSLLGIKDKILWYTAPGTALITTVLVDTWQWFPFITLLILAGILGIPKDFYDSAKVDGATSFQTFRYITLPLVKSIIVIVVLFRALEMLRVFDIIYIMTFGGPGTTTEVVNFYAYLTGFRYWDLGYTAAIGWILVIILTIGVTCYLKITKVS
jgi:multiple sugar transport system permease protein